MDLKILACAAELTLPTVSLQHPLAQLLVGDGIEPDARQSSKEMFHDTFSQAKC